MIRIKSDKIIRGEQLFQGYVYFENGTICAVTQKELPYDQEYDKTGYYVAPGFIDMHTHGGRGHDFYNEAEDIIEGCNFHLEHGTTSICPTISASPYEGMSASIKEAKKALASGRIKSNMLGLHMEGPYFSREQAGAQCADFITAPIEKDYRALVEEAKGLIARWSYAPENDEGGKFCKYLTDNGIVASAGHTNAIYDDMLVAMDNGCHLVTHLYSCTSTITRKQGFRRLGVIESAYLHDDMYVEIIADGRHLPPELIRLILKIKGTDKVALVTDSLAVAGAGITEGVSLNVPFIVEDGVCKLKDRSAFAGSIATADRLIRVMVDEVGVSVPTVVKMMTQIPARIMQVNKGTLEAGKDADIVVFDDEVQIQNVFVMGELKL